MLSLQLPKAPYRRLDWTRGSIFNHRDVRGAMADRHAGLPRSRGWWRRRMAGEGLSAGRVLHQVKRGSINGRERPCDSPGFVPVLKSEASPVVVLIAGIRNDDGRNPRLRAPDRKAEHSQGFVHPAAQLPARFEQSIVPLFQHCVEDGSRGRREFGVKRPAGVEQRREPFVQGTRLSGQVLTHSPAPFRQVIRFVHSPSPALTPMSRLWHRIGAGASRKRRQ